MSWARFYQRLATSMVVGMLATWPAINALAAGFAVGQEGVISAGTAHSGGAASADNASTVYYNPAGMTRLEGTHYIFDGQLILPYIDYDDQGSVLVDGTILVGNEGGNGGVPAVVPNFYGVWSLSDDVRLGIGLNAPFGLVTDYEDNWVGRYSEVKTLLQTINLNLSSAYKLSDRFSVGGGFSIQYAKVRLTQAIDFGQICVAALDAATCSAGFGLVPQQNDGRGLVTADHIGFGLNVGVLYQPTPRTRIGAQYRSRVNHLFDGDVEFSTPSEARAFFTAAGSPTAFTNAGANFDITMPETASLSAFHQINPKWAVMGDITWTRWSQQHELRIESDNAANPVNLLPTRWHDVFRLSVGASYKWSDRLQLRTGVAFDDSPIETDFRGPGIPDSDRYIIAVGAGYQVSDGFRIDAAFQHLFFVDGTARRVSGTDSILVGNFNINVNYFGLGFSWKF